MSELSCPFHEHAVHLISADVSRTDPLVRHTVLRRRKTLEDAGLLDALYHFGLLIRSDRPMTARFTTTCLGSEKPVNASPSAVSPKA